MDLKAIEERAEAVRKGIVVSSKYEPACVEETLLNEDIPALIAEVKRLQKENEKYQWISVKDRLPEDISNAYLALLESGNVIQTCDIDWECSTPKVNTVHGLNDKITYWKPITLPKEQSDE